MSRRTKARPFPIRGLMVDLARHTERREFYFDLLPQLADWGFNTLWWHFVDNEGMALKLDSHPELASPHAFSKREMRLLIQRAAELGIDVVPEVETLGHAEYITHLPQYAHLKDGTSRVMNACCPSHPDTLGLMEEIIREVAELFPSPYLHAGLDEVDFSGCERCKRRGRGKPKSWIFAEHARAIHRVVTDCGKQMIMWADHVEHDPALLDALPNDIVLTHWQYREVHPEPIRRSLRAGFQVITAPSMCHFRNMIQPATHNFDAMDEMTRTTAGLLDDGVLGMVNTWWAPQRGLRDAYMFAVAYTGRLVATGKPPNRRTFARRFAKDYFGLDDADAARALWDMHELAVHVTDLDALLCYSVAGLHELVNRAGTAEYRERAGKLHAHVASLEAAAPHVEDRRDVYNACLLAARLVHTPMANGLKMQQAYEIYAGASSKLDTWRPAEEIADDLAQAADLVSGASGDMTELERQITAEWRRTRYSAYPKEYTGRESVRALDKQMLLGRVRRHSAFLRKLAAKFTRAVDAYRRGGAFPGTM